MLPHLSEVDSLLPIAIAILCAFSQPDCQTVHSLPVSQGDTWVSTGPFTLIRDGHGSATTSSRALVAAYTRWTGRSAQAIVVSDQLTHPVAIAAVLAHEAMEIQEGYPPRGKDCDGYEGWAGQQALFSWFGGSFGPPLADVGSMDAYVFSISVPGQQPSHPC